MPSDDVNPIQVLFQSQRFSLTRLILQPDEAMDIVPMQRGDRLLIVSQGEIRCEIHRALMTLTPHQALGLDGRIRFEISGDNQVVHLYLVEFYANISDGPQRSGEAISFFDFNEGDAKANLAKWAKRQSVDHQVCLEALPPTGTHRLERGGGIFLLLSGALEVEAGHPSTHPPQSRNIQAGQTLTYPDGAPIRLRRLEGGSGLRFSHDPMLYHHACGPSITHCSLAEIWGAGLALISHRGHFLQQSPNFHRQLMGQSPQANSIKDLPEDFQDWVWSAISHGGDAPHAFKNEAGQSMHARLLPHGEREGERIYLLALERRPASAPENATTTPEEAHPLLILRSLSRAHKALEGNRRWLILWGGAPESRESLLPHFYYPGAKSVQRLNIAGMDPQHIRQLLSRGLPGMLHVKLSNLRQQTLVIEGLDGFAPAERAAFLKELQSLGEEADAHWVRVLIPMGQKPNHGLPPGQNHGGLLQRGIFTLVAIPPVQAHLTQLFSHLLRQRIAHRGRMFTQDAKAALKESHWNPTLKTLTERADEMAAANLSYPIGPDILAQFCPLLSATQDKIPTLFEMEGELIQRALTQTQGNKAKAAKLLGITRTRFYRKLAEHQLGQGS